MTKQQILDSLTAVAGTDGWYAQDDDRLIDWNTRTRGGAYVLEAGVDGAAVQMEMSYDDMVELYQRLAVTLLRDAE